MPDVNIGRGCVKKEIGLETWGMPILPSISLQFLENIWLFQNKKLKNRRHLLKD
jgi:hypothetical protein